MLLAWWICRNENLKICRRCSSAPWLFETSYKGWLNFWLTALTGISDLELVFGFHSSFGGVCLIYSNSTDSIPANKVLKMTHLAQMLGGPFLRLGIRRERLSIPKGTGWGGWTQVDWQRGNVHCALIQHLGILSNHWYNCFHSDSCILPVSPRMVSRSSTNFLWARQSSSFGGSIVSFNFLILLLSWLAWNSCFQISPSPSARICSLRRSWRILICSLSELSLKFLNTLNLWVKWWANDGSHRSIMSDWRLQTGRRASFLRVIGSSRAQIRERLADGYVMVVEVIGEQCSLVDSWV